MVLYIKGHLNVNLTGFLKDFKANLKKNMIDIVIPTCKLKETVIQQIEEIEKNTLEEHRIVASCIFASAAINRNYVHAKTTEEFVIMLDDDMTGFYPGWELDMILPLKENKDIYFSSARLLKPDRTLGFMMTSKRNTLEDLEEVPRIPTACFAYRRKEMDELIGFHNETSLPFDIMFKGSGWEDNGVCYDLKKRFPKAKIVINNNCQLIHINEEKEQKKYLAKNKEYFFSTRTER